MTLPTWRTLAIIAAAVAVVLLLGVGGWLWTSAEQQRGIYSMSPDGEIKTLADEGVI